MKLSAGSKHGLRAIIQLALNYGQGPTRIQTMAEGAGICDKYVEQLVVSLKAGGIIRSKQGPKGGYVLARHPSKIKVSQVIASFEGPIGDIKCTKHDRFSKGCCRCVMAKVWARLEKNATDYLESTTLQDLIDMKK